MKSLVLTIALLSMGGLAAQAEVIATAPTDAVARGEYLAVSVVQCIQCHSPHDREGDLLRDQLFTGQAMPFTSPWPALGAARAGDQALAWVVDRGVCKYPNHRQAPQWPPAGSADAAVPYVDRGC